MWEHPGAKDADREANRQSLEPGAHRSLKFPAALWVAVVSPRCYPSEQAGPPEVLPRLHTEQVRATIFGGPLRLIEAVRTSLSGLERSSPEEDRGGAEAVGCGGCEVTC